MAAFIRSNGCWGIGLRKAPLCLSSTPISDSFSWLVQVIGDFAGGVSACGKMAADVRQLARVASKLSARSRLKGCVDSKGQ